MKAIKILSLIFISLCLTFSSYGQLNDHDLRNSVDRKNIIDLTLLGQGGFLSANYSHILVVRQKYFLIASAGIGLVPYYAGFSIPHQLTFNIGKRTSFLEVGLGGTYMHGKTDESGFTKTTTTYLLSPVIGWRKNFKSHLVLRIYANPLFDTSGNTIVEDYSIVPFLGVSLGYSF